MHTRGNILMVDDDSFAGRGFRDFLRQEGFACRWVKKPDRALHFVRREDFDLVMVDWDLGHNEMNGQDLHDKLLSLRPSLEIQLFTAKHFDDELPIKMRRFPSAKDGFEKETFLNAVLEGVNHGLRKRLAWQQKVIESSGVQYMVLNESERVVWDSEHPQSPFNTDGLAWPEAMAALGVLPEQLIPQLKDFGAGGASVLQFKNGNWREFNFGHFEQSSQEEQTTKYSLAVSEDCTSRVRANHLINKLVQLEQFDEIATQLCEGCIELGFRRARLWILRGDGRTLRLVKWRGHLPSTEQRQHDIRLSDDLRAALFPSIDRGVSIVETQELDLDKSQQETLSKLGLVHCENWLDIPLRVRGDLIGILCVDMLEPSEDGLFRQKRNLILQDILLGEMLSGFAAAALDRGMSNAHFKSIVSILETVGKEKRIESALDEIITAATSEPWMLVVEGADIAVRDSKNAANPLFDRVFATPHIRDFFPKHLDTRIRPFAELARRIPATMEPHCISNIHDDDSFLSQTSRLNKSKTCQAYVHYLEFIQGKVVVPLFDVEGALLGFFSLHYSSPVELTSRYYRWLHLLAGICARLLEIREQNIDLENTLETVQDQLTSAKELSAFGEMTATIAHEIKKYFQRILNQSDISRRRVLAGASEKAIKSLQIIQEQAQDADQYLDTIKKVFRGSQKGASVIAVDEAFQNAVDVVKVDIQRVGATLTTHIEADLPQIPWDSNIALLVFGNLLGNACDALASQESGRPRTIKFAARRNGEMENHVLVTVEDSGVGIDAEHLDRVFDRGFSTKIFSDTRGLGWGLSLVKRIVEKQTGGRIWVQSTKGAGTTFYLSLPQANVNVPVIQD